MRILLSAYACEPNRGSEPGVGWNWAKALLEEGHEVWVITRLNNRTVIEKHLAEHSKNEQLHFIYYDLPTWLCFWKKGEKGVQVYYFLWQIGIYFVAKRLLKTINFDIIHHVTFVSIRFPSFLGLLGIPFIFGPVSGGEFTPYALRKSYPLRGFIWDGLRDILNMWVTFDPLMTITFKSAKNIYATTEDTLKLIPKKFQSKAKVQLAIGMDSPYISTSSSEKNTVNSGFKVLYVGNLLYLKGIHLGLMAFSKFLKESPDSCLTIIGDGPEEKWLKSIATALKINSSVKWVSKLQHSELMKQYPLHDVFLFPSLHDSGGMVILEAMSSGLPVVCLDLGGPGKIVNTECGRVVSTDSKNEADIVTELADSLKVLSEDPLLCSRTGANGRERVKAFCWKNLIQTIYE